MAAVMEYAPAAGQQEVQVFIPSLVSNPELNFWFCFIQIIRVELSTTFRIIIQSSLALHASVLLSLIQAFLCVSVCGEWNRNASFP
jgi:hypothetical protein